MFSALYLDKTDNKFSAKLQKLDCGTLPQEGDVLIDVSYSTLNYKDALAITNKGPIVRQWPMIPGIDLAGVVVASTHPNFHAGDRVILNGFGVGEKCWGGLSQKARVHGDWLIHLPSTITLKNAMAIGTAGFTAMLSILALEKHGITPGDGKILVTGATGGVASIAINLLAKLGFTVTAATGKPHEAAYLYALGATEIIERESLNKTNGPLQTARYAGVIDSVGSHTLANACAQTKACGAVTTCGLTQGMDFPATVMPFILRGISLYGINSVSIPIPCRVAAWSRLAQDLDMRKLEEMTTEIGLSEAIEAAEKMISGQLKGRVVVDVNQVSA